MASGLKKSVDIFINGQQATKTIGDIKKEGRKLNKELDGLVEGTDAYVRKSKELSLVNQRLTKHRKHVRGIGGAYNKLKTSLGGVLTNFIGPLGLIGVLVAVGSGVKNWVSENIKLQKSLSSLKSLTGASKEDIKAYKKEAIEMGRTTTLSASQAVQGFKLIGSAKPELLKNRDALIAVTKEAITLAEAAELELGPASQSLAGNLNLFNLKAEESNRVINALAAGSKEGAANIIDLNAGNEKFGAVSTANNITIEESIALQETLAEKNLKGAEAGTKLRNVLLTMSTAQALPDEAISQLEKYGVNTKLVSDKTLPLQVRLKELSKIHADSTALLKVFGKENVVAGQIILENVDKVEAYTKAVTGTNVASEQAAINTDNLHGELKAMSSAWEGLMLTIGGTEALFRPIVRGFKNFLNFVSDIIVAFREWDTLKMETVILKIGNALSYAIPFNSLFLDGFRSMINEQIRFKELTSGVVSEIKKEATNLDILTTALGNNNEALAKLKPEDDDFLELKNEQKSIIDKLKELYPEYTDEIDLHTASLMELDTWQKEINKNIIQNAINNSKAIEQEKIIQTIVSKTIELNKAKADAENFKNGKHFGDAFSRDLADLPGEKIQEEIDKEIEKLETLDQTYANVDETIRAMNINYAEGFELNNKLLSKSKERLIEYNNELNSTEDKNRIEVLKELIKSEEQQIQILEKRRKAEIDAAKSGGGNGSNNREGNEGNETDKVIEQASKLEKALERLKTKSKQFEDSLLQKEGVDGLEGLEKQLAALDNRINNKYAKEIAAAQKLSAEKGQIGIDAAEQLNQLELIKAKELVHESGLIHDKFNKKAIKDDVKANEKKNQQILNAERSLANLRVVIATAGVEKSLGLGTAAQLAAIEKLKQAYKDQAEAEKHIKEAALEQRLLNEEVTIEDYNAQKEQIEREHQQELTDIQNEGEDERLEKRKAAFQEYGNYVSDAIGIIAQFQKQASDKKIIDINKEKTEKVKALDKELKAGIISTKKYNVEKAALEEEASEKIAEIKTQTFKREKIAAGVKAAINTAVAVSALLAFPPAAIAAAIAGAAQVALIATKPIPQFKDGGMRVKGAQDGKYYNAQYLGQHSGGMLPPTPSLVLASELGPEYFVPHHLLSNPAVAQHVSIIEAIRTNQMFEGGFNTNEKQIASNSTNANALDRETILLLVEMMGVLNVNIQDIKVVIGDGDVDLITEKQTELAEIKGD